MALFVAVHLYVAPLSSALAGTSISPEAMLPMLVFRCSNNVSPETQTGEL